MSKAARTQPQTGPAAERLPGREPALPASESPRDGTTLLEVMIAVMIMAILTGIAAVAARRIQNITTETRFMSQLRTIASAFEQRSFQEGTFPAQSAPGAVPSGMADYLAKTHWTEPTPLGGRWAWVTNAAGLARGVQVVGVSYPEARLLEIDRKLDDGDLATGLFRKVSDGAFIYGVE